MSVQDAEAGDIYADEAGKLWRIIGVCHEPTVIAEEVEGTLRDPNAPRPPACCRSGRYGMDAGDNAAARNNRKGAQDRRHWRSYVERLEAHLAFCLNT